jgi:hypothetical protein
VKVTRRLLAVRRRARLEYVRGAQRQRLLRQLGFYVDMLNVLHKAKLGKPSWQPPLLHADSVQRACPPQAPDRPDVGPMMREIAELFYAARYGGRRLQRSDVVRAKHLVAALAGALKVSVPR